MKNKIILKILKFLFLISLISTICFISTTYAKYYEELNTKYDSNIKRWKVVVNGNEDIRDKTLSEILQPTCIQSDYIKDNVIAPRREGYYEIEIDYEKVDLPFCVDFKMEQIGQNLIDFELYGYKIIEGGAENDIDFDSATLNVFEFEKDQKNGLISPVEFSENIYPPTDSSEEAIKTIRVYFKWNDVLENGAKLDDTEDTLRAGTALDYNVYLKFEQIIDEN